MELGKLIDCDKTSRRRRAPPSRNVKDAKHTGWFDEPPPAVAGAEVA